MYIDYNRTRNNLLSQFKYIRNYLYIYKKTTGMHLKCHGENCSNSSVYQFAVTLSPNNNIVSCCCEDCLKLAIIKFTDYRVFIYKL